MFVKSAAFACLAAGAIAAPAHAATASWNCRGSAVEAQLSGQSRLAPLATDHTPCAADTTGVPNLGQAAGLAPGVTATTAYATTAADPAGGTPITQTVSAQSGVEGLHVTLVPGLDLAVDAARAQVTANCAGGAVGHSTLAGLTLNGQAVTLDGALSGILDPVSGSPLGAVVSVKLDERVADATGLTQRAAHIQVLSGVGGMPLADVVVAEAHVASNDACDPTATPNAPVADAGTLGSLCPSGTSLDLARGVCLIAASASGGMGEIVVGPPNQAPSGGTVLSLAVARARFSSPCLQGAGPEYAIVGTAGADRITGTNATDRILGLAGNDQLAGGRGDDCLDGGDGGDNLSGSIGNDRIYGMAGDDHLNGGPGDDRLSGGTGADSINTAFGADVVDGGPGVDFINAATAGKPARISCGPGRDKVRVNRNEVKGLRGCEVRYVLR